MKKLVFTIAVLLPLIFATSRITRASGYYFPPPGESLAQQNQQSPNAVGLNTQIIDDLSGTATRWALWRHGYLVHVSGDFNQTVDVKSLRKTWHAMTVGAAIKQGKIPDFETQKVSTYLPSLTGNDAEATWWHVLTQSTGFDYPGCGDSTDYFPGQMWTYSDLNLKNLTEALYKAWGSPGGSYGSINYQILLKQAYFDAIGMQGWSARLNSDGIRLVLDLEDMGRLGLLLLARGSWDGQELVPQSFVEEMETKQTQGMLVNYDGCNDGVIEWATPSEFPESPYGYLTWVNTDGDFYPGADTHWAFGRGSGGMYLLWNAQNGIVFAAIGLTNAAGYNPTSYGIPQIIEANILGPNPLFEGGPNPTTTPTSAITATPTSPLPPTSTPTQAPTQTIVASRPPTQTPPPSPTPTNPPDSTITPTVVAGASVNVSDLEGFAYKLPGSTTWSADVSIAVEDQNGQPLQNVSVTGTWSSGDPVSTTCTTDQFGQCTVTDYGLPKTEQSVSFAVSSLSLPGYSYQPGNNHDLDGDSDGTTFLVNSSDRN